MSVVKNSLTLFVLDMSSPMGSQRKVYDKVYKPFSGVELMERTTTDLQWVCEYIGARMVEIILGGLRTTKVALITYGSPRTNNIVTSKEPKMVHEGYAGIDEVVHLNVPTLDTLDLVQSLRAVGEHEHAPPSDPLAALVDAIQLTNDTSRGGVKDSQNGTWTRTIYLITDGMGQFSWDGAEAIKDTITEKGINLRVIGIDFDDEEYGFKEERKDELKKANEEFWHNFLQDIPEARIATAADAIEQCHMPTVQLTSAAAQKNILTFGYPEDAASGEAISIPIQMFKMTEPARPMAESKISKLARESAGANAERRRQANRMAELVASSTPALPGREDQDEDGEMASVPSYRVETRKDYFLVEDVGRLEKDKKGAKAEPLPAETVDSFTRAWKLGASLIPVPDEAFGQLDTKQGIEILHFTRAETYRRDYNMDQIWVVFSDLFNTKAQIQLSSLVRGLHELELIAIVRCVRRNQAEPELGVLWPCVEPEYDCFYYSRIPFREDYRRFIFPPLDRIITKEGQELDAGPSIPTAEDQEMLDRFVDSLDLMDVDGEPWFNVFESFNPAIHLLKDAIKLRFVRPDLKDVPAPHPELVKYWKTPMEVKERGDGVLRECKERFKVGYMPKKGDWHGKGQWKGGKKRVPTDESGGAGDGVGKKTEERLGGEGKKTKVEDGKETDMSNGTAKRPTARTVEGDDSETEDEDATSTAPPRDAAEGDQDEFKLKEEALSHSLPFTQPSARIGTEMAVENFKDLIKTQDDVTKVFVEMLETISYLLRTREYEKVVGCCKAAKRVAQKYEEAIRWNTYIRQLKQEAVRHHTVFWDEQMVGKLEIGLVTEQEDEAGQSDVSKEAANEFVLPASEASQ